MTLPFVQSLLRDRFLHLLLIIACVLSAIVPFVPASWPAAIDWHTIVTLSGLMLLTKGIELSGYFDVLGRKMARRFVTERQLAIFMVLAAALCAVRLCPNVRGYLVPSHASFEIGYRLAMEAMDLRPLFDLGMRLGEGSGCPLAFQVLDAACAVINDMATFDEAGINDDYLDEIRRGDQFTP